MLPAQRLDYIDTPRLDVTHCHRAIGMSCNSLRVLPLAIGIHKALCPDIVPREALPGLLGEFHQSLPTRYEPVWWSVIPARNEPDGIWGEWQTD